MKNRTSSRTGLFLMELILAVLFFSLASVLCIQMFVKSHTLSQNSVELNHSILWTQNVSECFYSCNGNAEELSCLFPQGAFEAFENNNYRLTLLYNDEFQFIPVTADTLTGTAYRYRLTALITPAEDHLRKCQITITRYAQTESIYQLTLSCFADKEVPYES